MKIANYENKVIHCKSKEEVSTLITLLEDADYEYAIPLKSLTEFAEGFIEENGCDGCWRISMEKGIAYNPSISHWLEYGYDVIEMKEVR